MWEELGISFGTGIIILISLYFVFKWAVRNGIQEAYKNITGKSTFEEMKMIEKIKLMEKEDEELLEKRKMKKCKK